uniref:Uncharacterized protein n=1 Tax=Panagrolaimus superbus TaxID=310955 RepID=A0A914Z9M4_9BILA
MSINSITGSTTSDSSPFKAAHVKITVKKGYWYFAKLKTVTGIHSHAWTQQQLDNQDPGVDNFKASINNFNTRIPTILKEITIGEQKAFDKYDARDVK